MCVKQKLRLFTVSACLAVFCAIGAAVLSGCEFNTYNVASPRKPSESFEEFMDALACGDDDTVNSLLYNYSWSSAGLESGSSGAYSLGGSTIDGADARLTSLLLTGRSYRIVSESDCPGDGVNAGVTVDFTSFDLGRFRRELTDRTVDEIRERQLDGEVFETPEQTAPVIEEIKSDMLRSPESCSAFYTTARYTVEMVYTGGRWKIILTNDFYRALTGYAD